MLKTCEVKGCITSFCKVSQSNYSSFPNGIWTTIFRALVFKAALMILLYNGYNSIVVFLFCYHCYATIIIVYIMHFLIQRINADKREGVNNFIPEQERFSPKLAFCGGWKLLLRRLFFNLSLFITTTMIIYY